MPSSNDASGNVVTRTVLNGGMRKNYVKQLRFQGECLALSADHFHEGFAHARVCAQFGMKCRSHDVPLAHRNRIISFGRDHFDTGADALDFWGANKNHL